MVKFYNNVENEEKFIVIVNCILKVENIEYEGFDISGPLDEMNDFMNAVCSKLCNDNIDNAILYWFSVIYRNWMNSCCCELSVEMINKSFEAALNGKLFYDVDDVLDSLGQELVVNIGE